MHPLFYKALPRVASEYHRQSLVCTYSSTSHSVPLVYCSWLPLGNLTSIRIFQNRVLTRKILCAIFTQDGVNGINRAR